MITRCYVSLILCLVATLAECAVPTEYPTYSEEPEYTTMVSTTTGKTIEVITPVALILRNRTSLVAADMVVSADLKSGATSNHLKKPLPNSTKNITERPIAPPKATTTSTTTTTPTPTTTTATPVPITTPQAPTTTPTPVTTEDAKINLEPRRTPLRGPHSHSCPRPEDIHPCECLEIKNHYDMSQIETVSFCKNIRNSEVLKDAMKGMQGHFINYFVLDSCKLPPFPNGLFQNVGIGWMEVLNSTVQFQESFFSCSNGCW